MKTANTPTVKSGKKNWIAPSFELIDVKAKSTTGILSGFKLLDPDGINS